MTTGRTLRGWLAARPVKDSLLLRSRIAWGDRDAAEAAVWGRWFFGEPPQPPSGPSIVQTAGAAVYGSIISATFPAPVTPGNSIVVLFDNATTYNAPPAGCSDDQGNAYTLDATLGPERHGYGDDYTVYVYRAQAVTNAVQTVGVGFVGGGSHAANIYAFEISGLADAPPADTFSASLVAGAGGTIGLTAAQARSVSLGAVRTAGSYTVTPDGGASVIEPYTPPVYEFGIWRNSTAAGDASLSFTLSASATKALFGVLYEGAAAGGGPIQGGLSSTLTGASASASAALSIQAQGGMGLATLTASAGASLSLRAQGGAALAPAVSDGEAALRLAAQMSAGQLSGASCAAGARLAVRAQGGDGVLGEALCSAEGVVSDPGLSLAAIEALAAAVWAQPLPLPASPPPYVPGPRTLSAAELARAVHAIWARTLP